ncbi:MAG: HAD hydrolase family protein [Candidatus Odinarchaeia archaeon]
MSSDLNLCVWDLEGPLSHVDFAAELFKLLEERINRPKLDEFFQMVSNYDDYLIENPEVLRSLNVSSYEPGDTLRLLAPFYAYYFTHEELVAISKRNPGLIPGVKQAITELKGKWEVYIISTSYTQHAYNIASLIGVPVDHVYCTLFPVEELKKELGSINEAIDVLIDQIFPMYLKKGLEAVVDDLNNFFFKSKTSYNRTMMRVKVRGGRRKEQAMVDIAEKHRIPLSEIIAVGDSITDMNMLSRVKKEGGIAISFNGNQYSIPKANIAVTSPNQMGSIPVFENHDDIWNWLSEWQSQYESFKGNPGKIPEGLVSHETRKYFIKENFVPRIDNLKDIDDKSLKEIIKLQKEMRSKVRGWVGSLG